MRPRLQRSQKTLFGGRRKNLRLGGQFEEQLFEDFKVELGVDVIQKKQCGLVETAAEKRQFRELQEEHDHLLLTAGKDFRGRPAVDRKHEQVALRTGERHARAQFVAANAGEVVDGARLVVDGQ